MDLSSYQGIIFDMDGTLVDSMPAHIKAWQQTCTDFELPFERDWFYSMGGSPTINTATELLKKYHIDAEPQLLVASKLRYFDDIKHKGDIIPATFTVLQQQKALNKRIAIGTGCYRHHALEILTTLGILPLVDIVVTANDVERHKPFPDTFLQAAQLLDLPPSACVVFEDTELGYQAAHAAGMDCYLVDDGMITELRSFAR
ncbi:carotenoid dehydrogenase [Photobacterium aquimaris]|uniref:Beta-phosphoglucomutase family hydrolase n=1 Tax=Photobacterium aquimaris TaxID=512643 RepID=A0A2T3ITB0_9GAMM|nr:MULTISPECIES: beta-phosphoglucomutase family hydrolase [Photobacterium]OBU18393.1 carotenoid dehydrogenase [Photobacterium aquimaris]OBU20814.1 carotenoid dehydrogenase [Photobacterium aquimaris]PSU31591.1 beta-phosphoglucomutase family hydrolase [Photobacterium aquimaris]PSW03275.1 beta-phosphoglucomutase family hydrolase [Photobacterium aquimaris]